MSRWTLLLCMALAAAWIRPSECSAAEPPQNPTWERLLQLSRKQARPILIHMSMETCGCSEAWNRNTLSHPEVMRELESWVHVNMDLWHSDGLALQARFKEEVVKTSWHIYLLDAGGVLLKRFSGDGRAPGRFSRELRRWRTLGTTSELRRTFEARPNDPEARLVFAMALEADDLPQDAQKVLDVSWSKASALTRGLALEMLGDQRRAKDGAVAAYRQAIEAYPAAVDKLRVWRRLLNLASAEEFPSLLAEAGQAMKWSAADLAKETGVGGQLYGASQAALGATYAEAWKAAASDDGKGPVDRTRLEKAVDAARSAGLSPGRVTSPLETLSSSHPEDAWLALLLARSMEEDGRVMGALDLARRIAETPGGPVTAEVRKEAADLRDRLHRLVEAEVLRDR